MDRVILHCDCNSYYASVESIGHDEYRHVPMAVCGDPDSRHGIILAKNEHAKKFGIQTAETVHAALRKCPHLLLLPPHHAKYHAYYKLINNIYAEYTDQVEAFSVDESWLDVTGSQHLFGSGKKIADALRKRVFQELELTISVGVSFNKVFAKLGSDYKKPDATTLIGRENFKQILWPLPATAMLFVGQATADTLRAHSIYTIGDIANAGSDMLVALLGKAGDTIWTYAMGLDQSPVKRIGESDPIKSISHGSTFPRNLVTLEDVRTGLLMLCDQVGTRLREKELYSACIQVQIKDPSLKVISRQRKLASPTNSTKDIMDIALQIVCDCWKIGAPIRLLTVSASNLSGHGGVQLSLLEDAKAQARNTKLDYTMDAIRARFGESSLKYGAMLRTDVTGKNPQKTEE